MINNMDLEFEMDKIYNDLVKISVNSLTLKLYIVNRNILQKTDKKDNRIIIELNKIIDFTTKKIATLPLII